VAATASSVASPREQAIAAAARDLVETRGVEGLTMRAVAEQLGIRAPSLYKHVQGKADLELAVMVSALEELAAALEAAAGGGLLAIGRAYRDFALAHPGPYRLLTAVPLPRERLPAGLEERTARPLVEALGGDEHQARAAWAFAHGMVDLELAGRFPPGADLDAAWTAGLRAFAG
jgi:AcrR family transcriptional regulator